MTLEKKIAEKPEGFVTKIEKTVYKMVILPSLLAIARKYAEIGDIRWIGYVELIEEDAKKYGINISSKVSKIKEIGYKKTVLSELRLARKYAKLGDVLEMEISIERAQEYAKKCGIDISDQIGEIRKVGYRRAIQKYAEKCGIDISNLMEEIKKICRKREVQKN